VRIMFFGSCLGQLQPILCGGSENSCRPYPDTFPHNKGFRLGAPKQQSYESDNYAFLRDTPNERASYGNGRVRTVLYPLGGGDCKFQTLAMILWFVAMPNASPSSMATRSVKTAGFYPQTLGLATLRTGTWFTKCFHNASYIPNLLETSITRPVRLLRPKAHRSR